MACVHGSDANKNGIDKYYTFALFNKTIHLPRSEQAMPVHYR